MSRTSITTPVCDGEPDVRMKVLVIGSGGREHALAWKLAQSEKVQAVFVAPGNGGTAADPRLKNLPLIDPAQLADFASAERIVLTVVGPEAPLAAGVVDLFRARGLRIFGPTQAAARLESSKAYACLLYTSASRSRKARPAAHWPRCSPNTWCARCATGTTRAVSVT